MTSHQLRDYINSMGATFEKDPQDSDYRRGYLAALIEVGRAFGLDLPYEKWEALMTQPKIKKQRFTREE